jgi:hypothetical protein
MVSKEDMRKAVRIFKDGKGTVQMKIDWLMRTKGFTYVECLEAMNEATDNALLKSAGVWD